MEAAAEDGLRTEGSKRLSKLGGSVKKNVERDLHRVLPKLQMDIQTNLELYWFDLPVEMDEDIGPTTMRHPMFLPHELLHAVYSSGVVDLVMLGPDGQDGVQSYWNSVRELPWAKNHPCQEYGPENLKWFCPVGLHGDDVGTTSNNKMLCLSVNSVLSRAESILSRLVISVLLMEICVPTVTLDTLYKHVAWSFRWCLMGVWPASDIDGRPWPPGSRRAAMALQPLAGSW